ncbi:MAG TPA: helix-turn-helix domain-containing protein [Roseiarcus sp.]|jgi:excisionase family DNA binding protein|nr:helix-turn-helix domain-containing protein [Roseiarcus sp.]
MTAETSTALVLRLDERGRALLSPVEASEVLGVAVSTTYKLMHDGKLPFLHIAGKTKIPVPGIVTLIETALAEKPTMRKLPWMGDADAPRKRAGRARPATGLARPLNPTTRR